MEPQCDFVIVGAGSAGCVLADRLTESGKCQVLLIESGGTNKRLFVDMPLGFGKCFFDPSLNWRYMTQPMDRLGGRQDYWSRGKILGGSSSIDLISSNWKTTRPSPTRSHGVGGPLVISSIKGREHPIVRAMIDSAVALQYRRIKISTAQTRKVSAGPARLNKLASRRFGRIDRGLRTEELMEKNVPATVLLKSPYLRIWS